MKITIVRLSACLSLALLIVCGGIGLASATTLTVTTTADSGPGSLRQAILDANADVSPGVVNIEFNIPGAGVHTIAPVLRLPIVTRPVTIDGYTQPGTSPNTLADRDNAVLLIELNGASLADPDFPGWGHGLYITADDCTVRGLVVNGFNTTSDATGIWAQGDYANTVLEGNFVGTDPTGTLVRGNLAGAEIGGGGHASRVGGLAPASRNIFAGNVYGLGFFVGGASNQVVGNFVGVGADGVTTVPNDFGIIIHNSSPTQIGGTMPAARNVISGNQNGVWVNNGGSNVFQGNFIGTDASGTLRRGNFNGISLGYSHNNLVGGTGSGEGNLISGNNTGVDVGGGTNNLVAGNLIGTDVTGTLALGNLDYGVLFAGVGNRAGGTNANAGNVITGSKVGVAVYGAAATNTSVLGNSIFGNDSLGIDLGFDVWTATPNDPNDADEGANHLQNFPEITAATVGASQMSVDYRVDSSAANSVYPLTVEFFIADGAGQGRTFIHRTTYSIPQITEHITFVPIVMPTASDTIVATATDANGNTSEFPILPVAVVVDTMPPTITCPANMTAGCGTEQFATVTYPPATASDNLDANPTVTCTPASGSASFAAGVTTVLCTAVDGSGNSATCSFTVTRAPLGFTGFLPPIGGEVLNGTGGTFADPVRALKFGSTIPAKFRASCGGTPIATGVHTLQVAKYSNSVDSDPAIDATPTDGATTGNQFRLTDAASGEWHFNLSTKPMSVGTWKLTARLSDGTIHEVWITIKK